MEIEKNIRVNDGFYMTLIACDRIISKETGQLLLTTSIVIYRTLSAKIRSDKFDQVTFKLT